MIYLDTNAVAYLYKSDFKKFDKAILQRIMQDDLYISPLVVLELNFMFDKNKISIPGDILIKKLNKEISLKISNNTLLDIVKIAKTQKWTRDAYDLLITSEAILDDAILVTSDRKIRDNYELAMI